MTHTDPSADAFLRRILSNPVDAVPRLVFADWLEESGTSSNLAWARYLRLADELANATPDDERRPKMAAELAKIGSLIRAKLTCRAEVVVAYPDAMLQLLPARCLSPNLNWVTVPEKVVEIVPISVAHQRQVLPLAELDRTLIVAMSIPTRETCEVLQFILNRDIQPIIVSADQLGLAIDRHYPPGENLSFPNAEIETDEAVAARLTNFVLVNAFHAGVRIVEIEPTEDAAQVSYHTAVGTAPREMIPFRLLDLIAERFRIMAQLLPATGEPQIGEFPVTVRGSRYRIQVQLSATPLGPHLVITIIPPNPNSLAVLNPAA